MALSMALVRYGRGRDGDWSTRTCSRSAADERELSRLELRRASTWAVPAGIGAGPGARARRRWASAPVAIVLERRFWGPEAQLGESLSGVLYQDLSCVLFE